jgi:hypothetical protein
MNYQHGANLLISVINCCALKGKTINTLNLSNESVTCELPELQENEIKQVTELAEVDNCGLHDFRLKLRDVEMQLVLLKR